MTRSTPTFDSSSSEEKVFPEDGDIARAGNEGGLTSSLAGLLRRSRRALEDHRPALDLREIGVVRAVEKGIARIDGLSSVKSDEVIVLSGGTPALVFNLDPDEIGVVLLYGEEEVDAGDEAKGTGRPLHVPVGEELLGRVIDPLGKPLDDRGPLPSLTERPYEAGAPGIMRRSPVRIPLQTGLKVVDALVPIGRGQRELIVGDRQTGKTSIAIDTIVNQRGRGVVCVYCAIGQRKASVAGVLDVLRRNRSLEHTITVVAAGEDPPGLQFVAPYAATTMAEHFVHEGRDVLIVYDDLTRHARAYRELSLLLRRPPGREGYPGDIFHIHARLLERSARLQAAHGGGSLTALPIVETQAGNLAAYIPTNLISITDGQICLSPGLFQKGVLPAVDVGRSVSRVGGAAQLPAYRAVVRDLKLSYSQFQELEVFSRFATQLDEETQRTLERGRRVREVLKQDENAPLDVAEQISILLAATEGVFDAILVGDLALAQERVRRAVREELPELCERILGGEELADEDRARIREVASRATRKMAEDA